MLVNISFFLEEIGAWRSLSEDNFEKLIQFFNNGTWFPPVEQNYFNAWSQPKEINSTLNYFTANIFGSNVSFTNISTNFPPDLVVNTSTLVLWGMEDPFLDSIANLESLSYYVSNLTIQTYPNSGHYLQHELTSVVAEAIVNFTIGLGIYGNDFVNFEKMEKPLKKRIEILN